MRICSFIVTGGDDALVGKAVTEFEAELNQAGVKHVYPVITGGTHSMFFWRPTLYDFLQKVFKPTDGP
jgi:enterochelin esterase-like enzyme